MPGVFAIKGSQNCDTSARATILGLIAATTVRPAIFAFTLGCSGTPADNAIDWILQRFTAAGTSTSVTPHARDPAFQGLAIATAGQNHTVEPTYTSGAIAHSVSLHQKATYAWQAYDAKARIVLPATANNGVGVSVFHSSYNGLCEALFEFEE